MILQAFPDLQWLKNQAEQRFNDRRDVNGNVLPRSGWPNVILNVDTKSTYRDNVRGPLSIFMNLKGESVVELGKQRNPVKEGFFFVTNQEQYYTLAVEEKVNTETFNIHFGDHFADQVWTSLSASESYLLENQFSFAEAPMAFHNRLVRQSVEFQDAIMTLRNTDPRRGPAFEERLAGLMSVLLHEESQLRKIAERLPPLRSSTRTEILKRLSLATDFIYANFHKNISLDDLASASCLSKFHFLRLFRIAFGRTPSKYIDELRVQKALHLLKSTNQNVATISSQLGYDNPSSFSRMFHNHMGVYPSEVRG